MSLMTRAFAGVLVGAVISLAATTPQAEPAGTPGQVRDETLPRLAERLLRLVPERPSEYFLLGEELSEVAESAEDVDLARTLFVLAHSLDGGRSVGMGPSACLALAELAATDDEARWLRALARAIDTRGRTGPDWRPPTPGGAPDETAFKLTTALGLIRSGEGRLARPYMEDPDVSRLFDNTEAILTHAGRHPGVQKVRNDMEDWRTCPECFARGMNQRVIRRPEGHVLCPTCGGNPGPPLSMTEFVEQLRYESILLNGAHRSWSAQIIVDQGAPLRDLDPAELAAFYNVDVTRPIFRDGSWRSVARPPEAG